MASAPIFASTPKVGSAFISTANTNRNTAGTWPVVYTAGTLGSLIYKVQVNATGSTTAGVVRLLQTDNTNSLTSTGSGLLEEIIVPAITPSTTVRVFEYVLNYPQNSPLILVSGSTLRATTNNAEPFMVFAYGGDI
jgi:hypothetical protein